MGREIIARKYCEPCADTQIAESAKSTEAGKQAERLAQWETICPPLYRLTDPNHPDVNQAILARVMAWRDKGDGKGLCLIGPSGRCKTRIMLLLAKRVFMEGKSVFFTSATRLAWAFQNQFGNDQQHGEARDAIAKAHSCRFLALDDVGKEKFTETVERDFYDLVEQRTSHLRPTHWTANATGPQLEAMMSQDRGAAIMRRLREFSEGIKV